MLNATEGHEGKGRANQEGGRKMNWRHYIARLNFRNLPCLTGKKPSVDGRGFYEREYQRGDCSRLYSRSEFRDFVSGKRRQ
jgi:hypothetical protein